nr:Ig-like domain-containing protein [Gammaproteobacteria bacterium]
FTVAVVVTVMGVTMPPPTTGGPAPVLVVDTSRPDVMAAVTPGIYFVDGVAGRLLEPLIIRTNPAVTLSPGSCQVRSHDGKVIDEALLDGLVWGDGSDGMSCVLSGRPHFRAAGATVRIRVHAENAGQMSNFINLEILFLQGITLFFTETDVSRTFGAEPFTNAVVPSGDVLFSFDVAAATFTWTSSDESVATVSSTGEVTLRSNGMTEITASYARTENVSPAAGGPAGLNFARPVAAASVSYMLEVLPYPPFLPEADLGSLAVDGQALTLSVPNAVGGADITECYFLDGATQVATLDGLSIDNADDGRSCAITGTLTGAGLKPFMVRALSATSQDDVTVNIMVLASSQIALSTTPFEFDVGLNTAIEAVTISNINTLSATALAAGNCVLVDDMDTALAALTVNGLTLATDVSRDACTVSGTPDTAGRQTLRVRANKGAVMSNIVVLTFIVRDIDTPALTLNAVTKRFGDVPFTNAIMMASSPANSFVWSSANTAVARVNNTGEVTVIGVGSADISAIRVLSDSYQAATLTYTLTVDPFPPNLPDGPVAATAAEDTPVSTLTLENASDGANITRCWFVSGDSQVPALSGLSIAVADETSLVGAGRACVIRGTLTGNTGERDFTVRALSASGQDEVTVTFTFTTKPLQSVSQFASGLNSTCAVSTTGDLYCWGSRGFDDSNLNSPTRETTATNWVQVSGGDVHDCVINSDRQLHCWGSAANRRLGLQFASGRMAPVIVHATGSGAHEQFSVGNSHTCLIDAGPNASPGGRLYCWGIGANHRLGLDAVADVSLLGNGRVGMDETWVQVSAGGAHTCATNAGGELHCWGSGTSGQTGQGGTPTSATVTTTPAQVGSATNWLVLSAGEAHTCAINTSGGLFCWGEGDNGRLGLNATTDSSTPAQVVSATSWSQVGAGGAHTCAVAAAGTLYCWGEGDNGRLGQGMDDTADKNVPTQVGTDTDWSMVSVGEAHSCASKTDNQLFCWGKGASGQLGLGNNNDSPTPARVTTVPPVGSLSQNALPANALPQNALSSPVTQAPRSYHQTDASLPTPQAPLLTVTNPSSINIEVPSTTSQVTGHEVWRSPDSSTGKAVRLTTSATAPHDDNNLSPATTYYYFLKACNTNACSEFSPGTAASTP